MTRGNSPRNNPAGRGIPAGRTRAGRKTPDIETPKSKGRSINFSLRKKNGAFNWNKLVVYFLVVIALIAITFPFWRGVVFPDPIDVAFAALTPEQRDYIRTLPNEQQTMLQTLVQTDVTQTNDLITALQQPPVQWTEGLPPGPSRVFGQGTFQGGDALHRATGTATIYRIADLTFLRLEGFHAINGPELHLYLSGELNPAETGLGTSRDLGTLKGTDGDLLYELTGSIVGFQSVIVYDAKYQKIYGFAPLKY